MLWGMDRTLFAAALIASMIIFPNCSVLVGHHETQRSLEQLTEMNAQMMLQIEDIARDIDAMKNPQKVEHIIRDELGYGRTGDLTLVF